MTKFIRLGACITILCLAFLAPAALFADTNCDEGSGPLNSSLPRGISPEEIIQKFAAKEAVFRALGTTWRRGLAWTDVEVIAENNGQLRVQLQGAVRDIAQRQGVGEILLSVGHCRSYATATALALGAH